MSRCPRIFVLLLLAAFCVVSLGANSKSKTQDASNDPRLAGAFRRPTNHGWTYVHVAGTPSQIGFQQGYLLAPEVEDELNAEKLLLTHDEKKDWQFFRDAAENMMWPHIEEEYREELQGIADGATAAGAKLDLWDVVAMNASEEWGYYVRQYDKEHGVKASTAAPVGDHCSAFVATGSYTKDGHVVIAHNNWSSYLDGERWTIMLDVVPASGYHFIMDTLPGFIHSGDDFGINSAGIVITETTIGDFFGYDSNGIPEFVRARKAMQYSRSIDDFARIMKEGNNGGYANDWLIADINRNEIASLELGLKNVILERKNDGYFVSSNFPINEKLRREETTFNVNDPGASANARHVRWEQLMAEYKGKIDLAAAEKFESDHYDTFEKKIDPDERTLCGHVDLSPRGSGSWEPPYGTAGAVQNKATTAEMAAKMQLVASAGHACGIDFKAESHLRAHPALDWEKDLLRDMDSHPWTRFEATK